MSPVSVFAAVAAVADVVDVAEVVVGLPSVVKEAVCPNASRNALANDASKNSPEVRVTKDSNTPGRVIVALSGNSANSCRPSVCTFSGKVADAAGPAGDEAVRASTVCNVCNKGPGEPWADIALPTNERTLGGISFGGRIRSIFMPLAGDHCSCNTLPGVTGTGD